MQNDKPIKDSLREYMRGIAGGLLFSFPLLYTMELWQAGFTASPESILAIIVMTTILLLGYNRYAGMHPDATGRAVFIDSIEELGIGLLIAFFVLLMLNRIELGIMGFDEIAGKLVIAAMVVSIGVSVGTAQLGAEKEDDAENKDESEHKKDSPEYRNSILAVAVLALCGGIVVGGNIAPTEEVLLIAAESEPKHVIAMILASLALSVTTVFFAEMRGSRSRPKLDIYSLVLETCICYWIALFASGFLLWFFGRFDGASWELIISQCIVLGVLSSLGSSAGRLLIK